MMISTMAPDEHFNADGSIAIERLSSAGRVSPLVQAGIIHRRQSAAEGAARRDRGAGFAGDGHPKATAEASAHGWHHTGDIGYLDADNFLFIVDRAKDMIITGGFNVYSVEVENALREIDTIQDCAVVGLPDRKWASAWLRWFSRDRAKVSMRLQSRPESRPSPSGRHPTRLG